MIFATSYFEGSLQAYPTSSHATVDLVRSALGHIRNRSMLLGWIPSEAAWLQTKETRSHYDVFVALIYIAQNIVHVPNVISVRLASGVSSLPAAPAGAAYSLTLFWSTDQPDKVYAHRSLASQRINVREDLGWNEHAKLKLIQFHQYPSEQYHEVELCDDTDVLRQGGSDG